MKQTSEAIEALRLKMIETGKAKGFTHPKTIKLSQELDELLNKQMKIGERS